MVLEEKIKGEMTTTMVVNRESYHVSFFYFNVVYCKIHLYHHHHRHHHHHKYVVFLTKFYASYQLNTTSSFLGSGPAVHKTEAEFL